MCEDVHFIKTVIRMCSDNVRFHFQEAEENKGATRWPEYYIDQLRSMAAVSSAKPLLGSASFSQTKSSTCLSFQRRTLLAVEDVEEQGRQNVIDGLKTALRTQPMRYN